MFAQRQDIETGGRAGWVNRLLLNRFITRARLSRRPGPSQGRRSRPEGMRSTLDGVAGGNTLAPREAVRQMTHASLTGFRAMPLHSSCRKIWTIRFDMKNSR